MSGARGPVVVLGGGVMGSAAAWALARRGVGVLLLEQYAPGHRLGSSHGSARIFRLAYTEPYYVRLGQRALPLWRELEADTGRDLLALTGAVDHGSPDELRARLGALLAAGEPARMLSPAAAAERWPGLRVQTAALVHPTGGLLRADDAVRGFQEAAARHGAEVRHGTAVTSVTVLGGDRVRLATPAGPVDAARVVVAAGGWAAPLLGELLPLPRLRVSQEQPVHFGRLDHTDAWPSFIHHPGAEAVPPVYGLAAPEGIKVGMHGGGRPVDPARRRDDADRIDEAAVRRLQDYARQWLPGVDPDRVEPVTCLYTLTEDSDFVVDRRGPLTVAAGFSGHGFKFAPAIGELVADLVLGVRSTPDRFALARRRVPAPAR